MWLLWKLMQLTLYFICDITAMCFGWILCSGLKWSRCFIQVKLIFTPMVTWPLFLGEIHQYSKSSSIEHEGINRKDKWQCSILAVGRSIDDLSARFWQQGWFSFEVAESFNKIDFLFFVYAERATGSGDSETQVTGSGREQSSINCTDLRRTLSTDSRYSL